MDDDLNVSAAFGALFDLVRELNRRVDARALSTGDARRAAGALRDFDRVFAVLDLPQGMPEGAADLLEQRSAARAAREWQTSDRLRDELAALGVAVEDTRDGQRWRVVGRPADG
jgi:cysteinyl-tRNA synthetase